MLPGGEAREDREGSGIAKRIANFWRSVSQLLRLMAASLALSLAPGTSKLTVD
jgi:hypothetical protein